MPHCSAALGLGDSEEKGHLTRILTAPQCFEGQKCRFCPTRHAFWGKSWGAVKKSVRGPFSSGSPSPNAELDLHAGFFENSSVGPSYAAFRTCQRRQNVENWVRFNPKRGSIFHCPPKYLLNFYLKFDGDFDYAIKHDLIPQTDQVLGVQR